MKTFRQSAAWMISTSAILWLLGDPLTALAET